MVECKNEHLGIRVFRKRLDWTGRCVIVHCTKGHAFFVYVVLPKIPSVVSPHALSWALIEHNCWQLGVDI